VVRGLEVFRGKGSTKPSAPRVTIQAKGVFGMNLACYEALGRPEAIEFLYNPTEQVIGFRKADPKDAHSYLVKSTGTGGGTFTVSGKAFLKYYEIPFGKSVRYMAEAVEGILVIDLKRGGTDANRGQSERIRG
jgi:hypothetical protein